MKLMCVAGPSHGRIVEIGDSYPGVTVLDQDLRELPPFADKREGVVVGPMSRMTLGLVSTTTAYSRRILREARENGAVNEIMFLAPTHMSDVDAIKEWLIRSRRT